jgi:hypothetical protein
MRNGWNFKQPAWPKLNDVESLQSWASWMHPTSMYWGGRLNLVKASFGKFGTIGRTYYNETQPIEEMLVESESATDFKGFEALHNIVDDIDDQLLCFDVQTEAGHIWIVTAKRQQTGICCQA